MRRGRRKELSNLTGGPRKPLGPHSKLKHECQTHTQKGLHLDHSDFQAQTSLDNTYILSFPRTSFSYTRKHRCIYPPSASSAPGCWSSHCPIGLTSTIALFFWTLHFYKPSAPHYQIWIIRLSPHAWSHQSENLGKASSICETIVLWSSTSL